MPKKSSLKYSKATKHAFPKQSCQKTIDIDEPRAQPKETCGSPNPLGLLKIA
jgi:hypothetical protein